MAIAIRPISKKDIEGYFEVFQSVVDEEEYLLFNPGELSFQKSRDWVLDTIKRNAVMVVAEVNGKIVGWCDITPREKEKEKHVGILGIGVDKGYRAKGIGEALIRNALERAKQQDLEKVQLGVFASNTRAYEFYKKQGFREEGREQKAAKIREKYVDHVLMAKFL